MDHNLDESLNLEDMDFEHSEDVVNQDDIPLEQSGSLNCITMDMDDIGEQSHTLMETVNDDVIVSDLIEEPFPFQEYTIQSDGASGSNIMIDPNQLNQMIEHHDAVSGFQTILEAPTKQQPVATLKYLNQQQETMPRLQTILKAPAQHLSNKVTLKLAQPRAAKRMVATAPPRQVAIAPKPVPTKTVQYAIAPKPVALVTNKQAVGSTKKVPISSEGKGSTVLAQIGRQLVMVPKKIKLMSSTSAEGVIAPSTGVQYQMACTPDQAQLIANTKGSKPMVKFIQLQGQSGAEQITNSNMLTKVMTNVPRARYVMQQKTVPISIGGNTVVQNIKIAGKKKIIAIKSQSPNVMQASQGNVATKKVVISSNNQKVLIRTTAPTSTSQVIKNTGSIGQHTQFHPINVPGKGIQYIKLVTNHPPQKAAQKIAAAPPKNFVFTDSKGNIIQMTAEKVEGQSSLVIPGATPAVSKGLVKSVKGQNKLVRIAPVSKAVAQTISQPYRSCQSLLAPNTVTAPASTAQMTSIPSISSPVASTATEAVTLEEFNDMVEQNNENIQQSFSHEKSLGQSYNYIDKSDYIDANDFSTENDYSTAEEYTTAHEYSADDTTRLHEETVEEEIDTDETMDVKPTLQSLISDVVSDERGSVHEMDSMLEVEIGCDKKRDSIRDAPFMHRDDSNMDRDTSNVSEMNNEESIIIVPGTNYMQTQNESMYSDESYTYRNRRLSMEDHKEVPLLSVEAECHPYIENQSQSPPPSEPDPSANLDMRPRKACNCTKSQCLKLYCDCFANGEFCNSCNCNNCHNNLENEETRQKAIRSCLERNPNAFRPKIGKTKAGGPEIVRRHTKGCNCKRSGCLKNYCECYEAKIACTAMCKCVGCRNVEETLLRRRDTIRVREKLSDHAFRPAPVVGPAKQPCSFMTSEVIEAVCQCLIAAAGESDPQRADTDPVQDVIEEFARCLQDVITASHHTL